jgi:hypothetical protein
VKIVGSGDGLKSAAPERFAISDEAGFVSFTKVEPGKYWLEFDPARDEGGSLLLDVRRFGPHQAKLDLQWPDRKPIETRNLQGTLQTIHYYPDRKEIPLSIALVDLLSGRKVATTKTDDQGHFQFGGDFPDAIYTVDIVGDEHYDAGVLLIEKTASASAQRIDVNLNETDCGYFTTELKTPPEINTGKVCGSVADPSSGKSLDNTNIWIFPPDLNKDAIEHSRTDSKGNFALNTREPGDYTLVIAWFPMEPFVANLHLMPNSNATAGAACDQPLHVGLSLNNPVLLPK